MGKKNRMRAFGAVQSQAAQQANDQIKGQGPWITRVFYNIAYHWMIPSPKGGSRSGFADIILWLPSPLNHPAKIKALKISLARTMEVQHVDENGAAILGLPDQFKYPAITILNWTRIMEDRVPESMGKVPPPVPEEMKKEFTDVPPGADVITAITKGNAPKQPEPDPVAAPDPASEMVPQHLTEDTGTNAAPPPEGTEPGDTSGDAPISEADTNLRPFRGKVNFSPEEDK